MLRIVAAGACARRKAGLQTPLLVSPESELRSPEPEDQSPEPVMLPCVPEILSPESEPRSPKPETHPPVPETRAPIPVASPPEVLQRPYVGTVPLAATEGERESLVSSGDG